MTIAKEVVYALHQRIKDLSQDATPDKVAYLAKALESIAGQSTVFDIVQMTDVKLKELLDSTTSHLSKLDTNKTNALAAISELEGKSLKKINDQELKSLSILDTKKDANIAAINSTTDLGSIKNTLKAINDLPKDSSIMKEVQSRGVIQSGSQPFLFGILSRYNDYSWGYGHFTSELGQWYINTEKTNNMFCLLTGAHSYDTSYVSFYKPPQLSFLQGKNGTFIYRELYTRYVVSSNEYSYPYALLGVIFVKNTTNSEITRTINFVGSSHWYSGYEGMGAFVGTPDNTNTNKAQISSISWKNIYNLGSTNSGFLASGSVVIPANKTVVILLYTSPYYYTSSGNYYAQFMQWGIYNFRSNFLTTGLEVDVERTLKAWQCPGFTNTFEIWK
ncbi:hypothetical protein IC220_06530 [Wolbachia endosymbiont of Pentalonia nigronervosa]|uniref:hypothetical protein n=1 Tax=Wolbachia endosymbiont of Pentalonia nigronervosa TaxID=1301914 RepID=UPI00165FDD7B|nr:hypothetical protein [Wolbachia endosymbiont of Pentalonia nigronervosa]MBD0392067.1 hypothetical protein [Wolbachia endosymbiont of Pentalonia nigronervosa]